MKTVEELERALRQFSGTNQWYKHYIPGVVYTDGIHYLMEEGHAWLIDIMASAQLKKKVKENKWFQVWQLTRAADKTSCVVSCWTDTPNEDGSIKLYSQDVEYTDSPFTSLKLFGVYGEDFQAIVLMVPGEY